MTSCSLNMARAGNSKVNTIASEPAEDCAGHKVGRENSRVPRWQDRRGKIERYDAVHGKNQWRGKASQQEIR